MTPQERTIESIVQGAGVSRADVRLLADGSREVWCYDLEGVLTMIHTVFVGGNYATRPAWRHTTDRRVGVGPFD